LLVFFTLCDKDTNKKTLLTNFGGDYGLNGWIVKWLNYSLS